METAAAPSETQRRRSVMIDNRIPCAKCQEAIEVEVVAFHGTLYPVFAHLCDEGRRHEIANTLSWSASKPVPPEILGTEYHG